MNLDEIKKLADMLKASDLSEIEIEKDGTRIKIVNSRPQDTAIANFPQTFYAQAPASQIANYPAQHNIPTQPTEVIQPVAQEIGNFHIIKSPIVGTFYASASPDSEIFVSAGSIVKPNTVVCIVEAMKVMNEILADIDGEIVEILIKSGSSVEFGQPLFKVKVD